MCRDSSHEQLIENTESTKETASGARLAVSFHDPVDLTKPTVSATRCTQSLPVGPGGLNIRLQASIPPSSLLPDFHFLLSPRTRELS